jgi:hypothetical protein
LAPGKDRFFGLALIIYKSLNQFIMKTLLSNISVLVVLVAFVTMCLGFALSISFLSLCGLFVPVGMAMNIVVNNTNLLKS